MYLLVQTVLMGAFSTRWNPLQKKRISVYKKGAMNLRKSHKANWSAGLRMVFDVHHGDVILSHSINQLNKKIKNY